MRLHFTGALTARDCKQHTIHSFNLTEGRWLEIDFAYAPDGAHGIANHLTLTLFDPQGFRGAGHRGGARHHVRVASSVATPGYIAGPLPPGRWTVSIDAHMIMPGEPVRYTLDITVGDGVVSEVGDGEDDRSVVGSDAASHRIGASVPGDGMTRPRGAGWYRGDLHTHTEHSDARMFSVTDLLRTAQKLGLDFVFLTDHNTTSGLVEMDAQSSPALLAAGGMELTTFWGHALCLGTRDWVDWRVAPGSGGMARLVAGAAARDHLFVIAHPEADGDPGCTGCRWRFREMMPGNAGLVEVWNGPWGCDSNNEAALSLWYDWLNQGLRLVATAGSDYHGPADAAASEIVADGAVDPGAAADAGVGFSVIYAASLGERELLDGLRAGHLYLSSGPEVGFEATDGKGGRWMMGDAIPPETVDGPLTMRVTWSGCPPDAQIRCVVNARLLREWPADGEGATTWHTSGCDADWMVVEVRDGQGAMLALTNPIYFGRSCDEELELEADVDVQTTL